MGNESKSIIYFLTYSPSFLSHVFWSQRDQDQELGKSALHVLALISQMIIFEVQSTKEISIPSVPMIPSAKGILVQCLLGRLIVLGKSDEHWNVRKSVFPFLQIFFFNHRFLLEESQVTSLLDFVINMLSDNQLEVRELVRVALTSIIMGLAHQRKHIESILEPLLKMAETPADRMLKRMRSTSSESTFVDVQLIRRHAGVLGLCAILLAFPYDIPEFLPKLLVYAASHWNDPTPIKEAVRASFADFWRTHYDEWEVRFMEKFNADQLALLSETRNAQNYYV